MKHADLTIGGMSCHHCLNAVSQALGALPGVDLGSVRIGRVELRYDETRSDRQSITAAVEAAGYAVDGWAD